MSAAAGSGLLQRVLKFNFVGLVGVGVQLAALFLFKNVAGLHYLVATALAVEVAVLHNFVWHERWTWADRDVSRAWTSIAARLLRFNLSNGLISILSNVVLMRLFTGALGIHYLAANLLAIAITTVANYLAADRFVFKTR